MIQLRIDELLKEHNMNQKELCQHTGLRPTTVSEMVRGIRTSINLKHLEKVMNAFNINDFNEILKKEQV